MSEIQWFLQLGFQKATMTPWLEWWVLPKGFAVWKKMRVVRIRGNPGCLGYVQWKNQQLTSNKSLAELRSTWGARTLGASAVIYHPTIPDPRNDWTFIGLRSKEEIQVRQELKRVQDWRSQMENQHVFKTDTCDGLRKNLGFSSDSCFFFLKNPFSVSRLLFPDVSNCYKVAFQESSLLRWLVIFYETSRLKG